MSMKHMKVHTFVGVVMWNAASILVSELHRFTLNKHLTL